MTYEIFITDGCNRNCNFCYVNHTGYVESDENISKFISAVKDEHRGNDRYEVNIFGGEPLMNFPAVKKVVDAFKSDGLCTMNLITNGDLMTDDMIEVLNHVNVGITTYDILDGKDETLAKYRRKYNLLKNCRFRYTLTEMDIDQYYTLVDIYRSNGFKHKICFSHDPNSWRNINTEVLNMKVTNIFRYELDRYLEHFSNSTMKADDFLESYIARFIQHLFTPDMPMSICVDESKKTFYRGRFVGRCIRLQGHTQIKTVKACDTCEYARCCTKGCFAEITDDVNPKLCTLEKARFNAVKSFLMSNPTKLDKILQYYYDKAFPIV